MRRVCVPLIGSILALTVFCESSLADGRKKRQPQVGLQAANQRQFDGGPRGRAVAVEDALNGPAATAAQLQAAQIAQMMMVGCDRDGDGALNLVELQAGLTALFQRMSMRPRGGPMAGLGGNQERIQQGAEAQGLGGGAAAGRAGRGGRARHGGDR